MAITLTTLNNSAATPVAKTFTEIAKDRTQSEWINSSDSDSTLDVRLKISQSVIGKTKQGLTTRRTLVQAKAVALPSSLEIGESAVPEEYTVNLTITGPQLGNVDTSVRKDLVAYVRNLCTNSVVDQLVRGEL